MLIYLHGYKSEYVSPDLIKDQIPEGLIEYSNEFNFILACPLCPFGFYWRTTFVFSIVKHLIKKYRVNESKIFLSGTSMGAYGTWFTAHEFPDSFTAIAPVSCGVYEIINIKHIGFGTYQYGLSITEVTKLSDVKILKI